MNIAAAGIQAIINTTTNGSSFRGGFQTLNII
jgi:hypothetical protein